MSHRWSLWCQAAVLGAVAAGIGRLATSGAYASYVRPGMRGPLLASAGVLLALAASQAWSAGGTSPRTHGEADDDHGHDHGRFPRIGVWLLVPILCIAAVPILPLGSGAVTERRANVLPAASSGRPTVPPPSLADGELTLLDFVTRVVTQPDRPFDAPVVLTGFVASRSTSKDEFVLGRFVMSCCAADAQPVLVTVRSSAPPPRRDRWVRVTGTFVAPDPGLSEAERSDPANVVVEATSVEPVDQPDQPYLIA